MLSPVNRILSFEVDNKMSFQLSLYLSVRLASLIDWVYGKINEMHEYESIAVLPLI